MCGVVTQHFPSKVLGNPASLSWKERGYAIIKTMGALLHRFGIATAAIVGLRAATTVVAPTGAVSATPTGATAGIVGIIAGTGAELVWVAKAANDGAGVVVDGGAGTV